MFTRKLGKSNIKVSAMGLGCWAIGGPWTWSSDRAMGWGQVDDAESIRAIHRALDLSINFFDTAANYGAGHSERILGQALAGRWHRLPWAGFGHTASEQSPFLASRPSSRWRKTSERWSLAPSAMSKWQPLMRYWDTDHNY